MKNFDINSMMKQMAKMQENLKQQMDGMKNSEQKIKDYTSTAGDDGIDVTITIDSNYSLKSIVIGDQLKELFFSDAKIYLNVLIDLIIAAYTKAKNLADEDNNSSAKDLENLIPGDLNSILGNLGNFLK
jgi:DNA-binding protein YbaB